MYKQTPGFHQLKGQERYQTASEACNRDSAVAHLPQVPTSAFLKIVWFVISFFHYCKSFTKVLLHLVQPESSPRPMVTHLWIQRQEFFTSVQGEVPFGISDKQIWWRQHSWISVQVMSMYVNSATCTSFKPHIQLRVLAFSTRPCSGTACRHSVGEE